jgi:hypothetical protein
MNKNRVFLIVQSVLCIILAVLLAAAAIGICREGLALKAADPLSQIYTLEKVTAALRPILPLLVLGLVMTAVGLFLGIRDENGEKPVKKPEALRDPAAGRVAAESAGKIRLLRTVLLVLAVALILAGVFNGSARDVFGKAVKICTECVGLG